MKKKLITLIKEKLQEISSVHQAKILQSFFKTGKGEYGEGDIFLGITIPKLRRLSTDFSKKYQLVDIKNELQILLKSPYHEERSFALMVLIHFYEEKNASKKLREEIIKFYLKNKNFINNWDLVDLSAYKLVGHFFYHYQRENFQKKMTHLIGNKQWNIRRIGIIASFYFIKKRDFSIPLNLLKMVNDDPHDLLNKAQGWMLREIGKREESNLTTYLDQYASQMSRVALRYAIEKLPPARRKSYLKSSR